MTTITTPAPVAHTTRRNLLIAAPAVAALVAVPAMAFTTSTADRSEWNAARNAFEQLKAEDAAFSARYMALWDRCKAACERIPHVTLRPDPALGQVQPVTTADTWAVRMARYEVQQMDAGKMWLDPKIPGLQTRFDLQREIASAADERDAAIQAVRDSFGMDDADEESDQLGNRLSEAADVLMSTPAPDLAALRCKLDYMFPAEGSESTPAWSNDFVAQALADIARLLPKGA